jgi:hypothetical protein
LNDTAVKVHVSINDTALSLHPFDNSIVDGGQPTGIRGDRARLIDAPSVLFACDPVADVPLTECSMTLCGQRDSHAVASAGGLTRWSGLREAA